MENVGYNMFSNKNLNKIISLVNESEKQTVFNDQPEPLSREDKMQFAESLRVYSQMGETIYGRENLQQVVERIVKMVDTAKRMVNETADDVVDSVNAGRHMKLMDAACKDLQKSANEIMIHERRMSAAYEDIAEGLKKYYDIQ
jgi:hypothetical protein